MGAWSDADTNQILVSLWQVGSELFPDQAAKVQDFVVTQAEQYGITVTQQKLAEIQANPMTPVLIIIGAVLLAKVMSR